MLQRVIREKKNGLCINIRCELVKYEKLTHYRAARFRMILVYTHTHMHGSHRPQVRLRLTFFAANSDTWRPIEIHFRKEYIQFPSLAKI